MILESLVEKDNMAIGACRSGGGATLLDSAYKA